MFCCVDTTTPITFKVSPPNPENPRRVIVQKHSLITEVIKRPSSSDSSREESEEPAIENQKACTVFLQFLHESFGETIASKAQEDARVDLPLKSRCFAPLLDIEAIRVVEIAHRILKGNPSNPLSRT